MRLRRALSISLAGVLSFLFAVQVYIGFAIWSDIGGGRAPEIGLGPGLALAQGLPMGPPLGARGWSPLDDLLDGLNLTNEQRASIDALVEAHRQSAVGSRPQMREARRALMQAIHADEFDEARIREAAATVSGFEVAGAVSMARLFQGIRAMLTPDQQRLLQDAWTRPPL